MRKLLSASTVALAMAAAPADAAYTFTFAQNGADVVVTGTGSFKSTNFGSLVNRISSDAFVEPGLNTLLIGTAQPFNYYSVSLSGVYGSWGSTGDSVIDGSGSGSPVYFNAIGFTPGQPDGALIGVPVGYTSGTTLNASATFANQSLASLKLRSGAYSYFYGSGASLDTINVVIPTYVVPPVTSPIPEPATWAMIIAGMAAVGGTLRRRQKVVNSGLCAA